MIWLAMAALLGLVLSPLGLFAWRAGVLRGRKQAALALHRAQLAELDRDLAQGRLVPEEHAGAVLEVQRRLLSVAEEAEDEAKASGFLPVILTGLLVPAFAIGLYLMEGVPNFPPKDMPQAEAAAEAAARAQAEAQAKDDQLIAQLRARLALMDVGSEKWVEGYTILGKAEYSRQRYQAAVDAWKVVLKDHFDPGLAANIGEVLTQAAGAITPEALDYFKRSAAASPPDAPWMKLVTKRLREAAKG